MSRTKSILETIGCTVGWNSACSRSDWARRLGVDSFLRLDCGRGWIGLLDLMFPPLCVDCGMRMAESTGLGQLCYPCRLLLQSDRDLPTCLGCGLPRPDLPVQSAECLECRQRKFRFDRVVALGLYRGHLRQTVVRMKQFHEIALTVAVGQLLAERLIDQLGEWPPTIIVPIPKYWVKRVLRGTNTSEVLAETLARSARGSALHYALRCRKSTLKQSLLGRTARQRNLAGALQLARGYDVRGADVLIVDDIMTTGATANEAARALRRAGAGRVRVAVVARAALGREYPWPTGRNAVGR